MQFEKFQFSNFMVTSKTKITHRQGSIKICSHIVSLKYLVILLTLRLRPPMELESSATYPCACFPFGSGCNAAIGTP